MAVRTSSGPCGIPVGVEKTDREGGQKGNRGLRTGWTEATAGQGLSEMWPPLRSGVLLQDLLSLTLPRSWGQTARRVTLEE